MTGWLSNVAKGGFHCQREAGAGQGAKEVGGELRGWEGEGEGRKGEGEGEGR